MICSPGPHGPRPALSAGPAVRQRDKDQGRGRRTHRGPPPTRCAPPPPCACRRRWSPPISLPPFPDHHPADRSPCWVSSMANPGRGVSRRAHPIRGGTRRRCARRYHRSVSVDTVLREPEVSRTTTQPGRPQNSAIRCAAASMLWRFSSDDIEQIYNQVFAEEHEPDAGTMRFDANPRIGRARERLQDGIPHSNDFLLTPTPSLHRRAPVIRHGESRWLGQLVSGTRLSEGSRKFRQFNC